MLYIFTGILNILLTVITIECTILKQYYLKYITRTKILEMFFNRKILVLTQMLEYIQVQNK